METSESEAKALKAELKLVSMDLEKIKASEKSLMVQMKSLETQVGEFIQNSFQLFTIGFAKGFLAIVTD